jgi:hypothetical protein
VARAFLRGLGLRPFDYASCLFGIVASLGVILLPNMPGPLLFMIESMAAVICVLFLSTLAANFFAHHLNQSEERVCFYHVVCNFIPTVHLFSRLKETPWDRFVA